MIENQFKSACLHFKSVLRQIKYRYYYRQQTNVRDQSKLSAQSATTELSARLVANVSSSVRLHLENLCMFSYFFFPPVMSHSSVRDHLNVFIYSHLSFQKSPTNLPRGGNYGVCIDSDRCWKLYFHFTVSTCLSYLAPQTLHT